MKAVGSLRLDYVRDSSHDPDRDFAHSAVSCCNGIIGDLALERAPMRVYGMLLGALLAAAAMTTSVSVARANPSTITSVDIAHVQPVGSYAGLTFRYIEGAIHGEVSAEEPIAGLRELAGRTDDRSLSGRASTSLRRKPHLTRTPSSLRRQIAGGPSFPGHQRSRSGDGPERGSGRERHRRWFSPEPQDFRSRNPMANGIRRRRAPERARDRRSCRPRFWPLARRRIPKRGLHLCRSSAIVSWPA